MANATSFIANVNKLAAKVDTIVSANNIFDTNIIPILEEVAALDLQAITADLKKGTFLGNRKLDIDLALNVQGITSTLKEQDPAAAEAIWATRGSSVLYDSATITFVDGVVVELPFLSDNNPTSVSNSDGLLVQFNRTDVVNAVAQEDLIYSFDIIDNNLYTVTIDNIGYTYTTGVGATKGEIVTGLTNQINSGSEPWTAYNEIDNIRIKANIAGNAFIATVDATMLIQSSVANVTAGNYPTAFLTKLNDTSFNSFTLDTVNNTVRLYDVIGASSNIEKIQLHTSTNASTYNDTSPVYYWAKTTSALTTLSMRTGDIIKLGNEIDNIILLASNIDQVLAIQNRVPELVDTYVNGVAQGDVTIYNKLTELHEIYLQLAGLVVVYNDIKAGGTNYTNSVATDLQGANNIGVIATDLNLGAASKIDITGSNMANIATVADDKINVDTVATNIADVNTVATNIADVNTTATDIANVNTAAGNITSINTVSTNMADINTIVTDITNIDIVATDIANVDTIVTNMANVDTTAINIAGINTIATDIVNVNTVVDNINNVITIASDITNVDTVVTNIADVNTVATNIADVNTISTNILNVNTVATDIANVNTVATNITNLDNIVTTIIPNITEVLNADANAATATTKATEANNSAVAAAASLAQIESISVGSTTTGAAGTSAVVTYNSGTNEFAFVVPKGVKGDKGDSFAVNAVGLIANRSIYDGQTQGFSFLAIDQSKIYFKLSAATADWSTGAPFGKGDTGAAGADGNGIVSTVFTSSTGGGVAGAAGETDTYTITYTDATTDTFSVHNGIDGSVAQSSESFIATAGQTTFTIAAGYTVGLIDVYLNGSKLLVGTDYTANDGSTVILGVAAALNDVVDTNSFGAFQVANTYTKGETDTLLNAKEPADVTILKDADIGVNVQAYDASYGTDKTRLANTSGTNTGDQDISGIATNASNILLKADKATTYTKSDVDSFIGTKQDTLVSGTNIKTINGVSILGSGNIITTYSYASSLKFN